MLGLMSMPNPAAAPPRDERARTARLLSEHPEHLSDVELLALVLGGAVPRGLGLSRALLEHAGGLERLLTMSARELVMHAGLGAARAARLHAALELGRRSIERPPGARRALANPADAARFFRARLADLPHEAFSCLFLDTRHRVIRFETLFRGTVDGANVYPREVVKRALYHNAAAVVLGHNHPSGSSEPSAADRSITARLATALELVDVRLLDHVVVSRGGHVSLAERGWI